ncbi:Putative transporter AraJ [BD1-7 clade bacterium]|uniref:Transporter AraJ n=1 Tax=BD1-7 clade bacterium TaxID=2029982 RepID=A0A5S9NX75_9GAMM|nr:Putative transporter AraJ [BD1-7 clade bacterium]CAA0095976.1 Putative transporter AraJ [BD1-7 clade bacterium]
MQKSVLALAAGGLGIGLAEFATMGIFPDISSALNISVAATGYFIVSYALGVVVGSPLLIIFGGRYPPKALLIVLMLMFTVFNLLSAFATSYDTLLVSRFMAGLPHGAFFGVASVVANQLAIKGKESQTVALLFGGFAVANLVGVPLVTWVGNTMSWRGSYALVALVGLVTVISISIWVPAIPKEKGNTLGANLNLFKQLDAWLAFGLITVGYAGFFAFGSYLAPLLITVTHFPKSAIPYMMCVAGMGMVAGNLLGGRLADRIGAIKTIVIMLTCMTACWIIIYFTVSHPVPAVIMTFFAGATSLGMAAPIQVLIIRLSGDARLLGSAMIQASYNVANAMGAFLGGIPIAMGYSDKSPELVGAILSMGGLVIALCLAIRLRNAKRYYH